MVGPAGPWAWPEDARGRTVGYISLDATGVGIQGPTAAGGRMVDVGLICAAGADGRPGKLRAVAGIGMRPAVGGQLRRRGAQVGLGGADARVARTDGGAGPDEFMRARLPRAESVLDFCHAAEHLADRAKDLSGSAAAAAGALAGDWCHRLRHAGGAAVLATLGGVDLRGREADVRETHRLAGGYVRNNRCRMDYPRYRANGWPIGSGHVESACKGVIGLRLTGCGMRWSEAGADAVFHLRAPLKSEKGQWDAFWATAP